ncbi:MAG TPA: hypothetical protein VKE69_15020, partial [Planctomycetota bacterium]|nr:hypothetical protein [Planctomycetota bacterium]
REVGPGGSTFRPGLPAAERARLTARIEDAKKALADKDPAAALGAADEVLASDSTSADAHHLRARALDALDRCDEARASYLEAMERDAWPSRAREWIQEAIRATAVAHGAVLVDLAREFDAHGRCGVAGSEWICDDVHPTVEGHRVIADGLLHAMADAGVPEPRANWRFDAERPVEEVRRSFGTEETVRFATNRALGYLKLFEALTLPPAEDAERRRRAAESRDLLADAHSLVPSDARLEMLYGTAEIFSGDAPGGAARLKRALAADPSAAKEFARVVEAGPGFRTRLEEAGVDVLAAAGR